MSRRTHITRRPHAPRISTPPVVAQEPPDHDISLRVHHGRDSVTASEPRFGIYEVAATREEAVAAFWQTFYEAGDTLAARESDLSDSLRAQLAHIRAVRAYEPRYERQAIEPEEESNPHD